MNTVLLADTLLRISGLVLYFLLSIVLILQVFKPNFSKSLGKIVCCLMLVHPLVYIALNYFAGEGINPYSAFINACLICKSFSGYLLSIGIFAFWITMLSLYLAFKKWKYAYMVNYLAFFLIGIHGFFLGQYFRILPVLVIAAIAYAVVLGIFLIRELPKLFKDFKEWVRS